MKQKALFLLMATTLLLSGCNNQPKETTSSSNEESSVPETESSTTVPTSTSLDPSESSSSSSSEIVLMDANYRIVDENGVEEIKVVEGEALTHKLIIDVENLPEGKTIEDCTFTFPNKIDRLAELQADAALAKNERYLVVENAGVYSGDVVVTCGSEKVTIHLAIEIEKDHSLYTKIATAAAFKTQVLGSTSGRFELTADIDLENASIKGWENEIVFGGILDGNGHSITNFTVPAKGDGTEGGLWQHVGENAIIRDVYFHGGINQPAGWGSLLGKEVRAGAVIENCFFEGDGLYTPENPGTFDWTWCRSGIVAGFLMGMVRNCVVKKNSDNNQVMDVAPYAASSGALIQNVYTSNASNVSFPFDPDPGQDWCGTATLVNVHAATNWSKMEAASIELSEIYWNLADGAIPSLRILNA